MMCYGGFIDIILSVSSWYTVKGLYEHHFGFVAG